jgi:hypothetical protein
MSNYIDFDIEIGGGPAGYQITARSPEGEVRVSAQFALSTEELVAIGVLNGAGVRKTARAIGQKLFDELFKGTVRTLYGSTQTLARQKDRDGVRVRLAVLAPELAGIPWELLYDPGSGNHLCLTHATPLVRTLPVLQPLGPIAAETPLRLLAMVSQPTGMQTPDAKKEIERLNGWLKPLEESGRVVKEWVAPTWVALQDALQKGPWHIFYFIGHGGFDEDNGEGYVVLTAANGDEEPIFATDIGGLLANHDSLRLVQLVACDGAKSGVEDVFSSSAATLMQRGLPAVLAMQRPVSDEAAAELNRAFYGAVANGLPVDIAVVEARVALRRFPNSTEWVTPALFLRAVDGVLFAMSQQAQPTGMPAPTATPKPSPGSAPAAPLTTARPGQVPAASQPAESVSRSELRRQMMQVYGLEDLASLCEDVTDRMRAGPHPVVVALDLLPRGGLENTILELIKFLDRRGKLQYLLDAIEGR